MIAGQLEILMRADVARIASDMHKVQSIVGGSMEKVESAVGMAKTALGALGIGLSAGYFVSLIKGSIDAADKLKDLGKSTNITIENLAGLKLAAKQSGGDLEGIAASINKLSQNMGKDAEKFKALGISAKDPLEAFKQLSDVFVAIQDPQQRAAVMAAALGKSWASAAPLLAEGGKAIGEMVEKGAKLSGVTKEMAEEADKFNDQMAELNTTLGSTMTKALGPLLPGMNDIATAMREAAKEGGLLLTIWVGLGGAMANLLGMTEAQKTATRLREISDELEAARKRLQVGSTNPVGSNKHFFSFLVPDIKVGEAGLAKVRATIDALEKEKARLAPGPVQRPGADISAEIAAKLAATAAAERKASAFLKDDKAGAKLGAAELKLYQGAVKGLEQQLGDLDNATESQKLHFAMYGKEMTLADGSAIHLAGSLEKLIDPHKKVLSILAAEIDARKALKAIGDETAKIQAEIDALEKYAAMAEEARESAARFHAGKGRPGQGATPDVEAYGTYVEAVERARAAEEAFRTSKGQAGQVVSLVPDIAAFGSYAEAAGKALGAEEEFRAGKGRGGAVASLVGDVGAFGAYAEAADFARAAALALQAETGKVQSGADLQHDVAGFGKYAEAAQQAQEASAMFQSSKGAGEVTTFMPDIAAFGNYAGAAEVARSASLSFIASKGGGATVDLQPDVAQFGKYADAAVSAAAADASFKTGKSTTGKQADLQAQIAAFAKYADAAAHAKETLVRFETAEEKNKGLDDVVKAQLIEKAQLYDLNAMKKSLLTETSKNYAEALRSEVAASLQLSLGAAAATAYGDAIVKLQTGQLAALDTDQQRAFMLSALSKTIADANKQTADMTTTLRESADAIALEIELLGQDRFATQYAAEAKMRLALANKMVEDSFRDSAIAAAKNVDALNKIKDAANLGRELEDKTKQLNIDMILDDRQRARAQIQIETAKFRQQIDLYERAYEHMAKNATDATTEQLAAQRKVIDSTKQALNDYTKAIADKQIIEEFREIWSTVESTGKTVFMNVFSDGKSAFEGIGKAIKASVIDLLYQLTVKKWIIQIGAEITGTSVAGAAAGAMGGDGGGGMGGILNLAGTGISKAFGGSGSLVGDAAGWLGIGGQGAVAGLGGTFGTAAAIGELGGIAGAAGAGATAAASGAAVAGGVGAAAAIPYVGWAIAAYALLSGMGDDDGPKPSELGLFGGPGGYWVGQQNVPGGEGNLPLYNTLNAKLNDPKQYDPTMLAQHAGLNQWSQGGPGESAESMMQKLIATLEPARAAAEAMEKVAQVTAAMTAAFKEMHDAVSFAQDPLKFLTAKMHELHQTAATSASTVEKWQAEALALKAGDMSLEQLAKFRELGEVITRIAEIATQAEQERIDSIEDAVSKLRTAYQREASELEQMAAKWRDAADGLRAYGESLLGVGSRGMSYAGAASKFAITAAQSRAGDMGAMDKLQDVSETFRTASLATSTSALDYARDLAMIRSAVGDSATVAERQESVALMHRDLLTLQVETMIDVKDEMISFNDSMDLLRGQIDQLRSESAATGKQSKRTAEILEGTAIGNFSLATRPV